MIHTVKTTCAISALLVSFAATAHAANVVSDPYASYIDCSKSQNQSSGSSGCTMRGQQVSVTALSQMMAAANTKVNNLTINNLRYGGEKDSVQYERGKERGADGRDREVKQLVFLVDNRPKDDGDREPGGVDSGDGGGREPGGRTVNNGDVRDANGRLIKDGRNQPTASSPAPASSGRFTLVKRVYKLELSDAAAAEIEKLVPRKRERDEGVSTSSRSNRGNRGAETWNGDETGNWDDDAGDWENGEREVVIPLQYASDDEIKAEEAKLANPGSASAAPTPGTVAPNAGQNGEEVPVKVMILKTRPANNGQGSDVVAIRLYNAATSQVIWTTTVRGDTPIVYSVREVAPVTQDLAQGSSSTTSGNVRDQFYSGFNNTPAGQSNQSEPMDNNKDNPDSGRGGAGT